MKGQQRSRSLELFDPTDSKKKKKGKADKEDEDEDEEDPAPEFKPAKPLEFFRNIDEEKFEWLNKSEIQPGGTTCGFLHAPLGWGRGWCGWPKDEGDIHYPTVDVCKSIILDDSYLYPRTLSMTL